MQVGRSDAVVSLSVIGCVPVGSKKHGSGTRNEQPPFVRLASAFPIRDTTTMAKSNFSIKTVSSKDAQTMLRSHRAGRGGRTSKFQPVLQEVQSSRKGQIVTVEGVQKNQVQTLRSFVYRHVSPDDWTVKSAREKGKETYAVAIGRAGDFD